MKKKSKLPPLVELTTVDVAVLCALKNLRLQDAKIDLRAYIIFKQVEYDFRQRQEYHQEQQTLEKMIPSNPAVVKSLARLHFLGLVTEKKQKAPEGKKDYLKFDLVEPLKKNLKGEIWDEIEKDLDRAVHRKIERRGLEKALSPLSGIPMADPTDGTVALGPLALRKRRKKG